MRAPRGLERQGRCWVLRRALCGTRRTGVLFGRRLKEVLERAGFVAATLVLNMFRYDTPWQSTEIISWEKEKVTSLTTWTASRRTLSCSSVSEELEVALAMRDTCLVC